MEEEKRFFSKLSSRASFFAGIGAAAVLFFVIGFFVLLSMVLTGDGNNDIADVDLKDSGQVAGEKENPDSGAGEVSVSPIGEGDWIRGNKDADIALVIYSDIECPYCRKFYNTAHQLLEEYPRDLKVVYRHLPLESLHPNAQKNAEAAECAGEIGGEEKYWEYLDLLYSTDLTGVPQLSDLASSVGIDKNSFDSCLSSGKYADKVSEQMNDGAQAAESASYLDEDTANDGRWGTPFSVLLKGDQTVPVPGAYPLDYLKSVIESMLSEQ